MTEEMKKIISEILATYEDRQNHITSLRDGTVFVWLASNDRPIYCTSVDNQGRVKVLKDTGNHWGYEILGRYESATEAAKEVLDLQGWHDYEQAKQFEAALYALERQGNHED